MTPLLLRSLLLRRLVSITALPFTWIVCCQPFVLLAAPTIQEPSKQVSPSLQQCQGRLDCGTAAADAPPTAPVDPAHNQPHLYSDWLGFVLKSLAGIIAFWLFIRVFLGSQQIQITMRDLRKDSLKLDKDSKALLDQTITELLAVELRRIFNIHDLAYQYIRDRFRSEEIANSQTCADMTRLRTQIDATKFLMEDTSKQASPFHEDLGQITTQAGPINAAIPVASFLSFFKLKPNIMVQGSVQSQGEQDMVIAQLLKGKDSWSWRLPSDHDDQTDQHNYPDYRHYVTDLAYHMANRIMGQSSDLISSLPGRDFKKYTQFLESLISYLQAGSEEEAYNKLCQLHEEFSHKQPTDTRTYYMNYIMALIAIRRSESQGNGAKANTELNKACNYLKSAVKAEPMIVTSILNIFTSFPGPWRLGLNWKPNVIQQLCTELGIEQKTFPPKFTSFTDKGKAVQLANNLGNVSAAMAYVLEKLPEQKRISQNPVDTTTDIFRGRLEQAIGYYQRASSYDRKDPLYVANQAEAELKLSDHLIPNDSFLVQRLNHRTHICQLLNDACREEMKEHKNYKYALLRNGNFNYYLGDFIRAEECFLKALQLDSTFFVASRNLASVYSARNLFIKALDQCDGSLDDVSTETEHTLLSQSLHGWIHNNRGWAYLQLAIRHRASMQVAAQTISVQECESWLDAAQSDFFEAFRILKEAQTIPVVNVFLLALERFFGRIETHGTDFFPASDDLNLKNWLVGNLNALPPANTFTKLYRAIAHGPKKFLGLFQACWNNHELVSSEYYGLINDLLLLRAYLKKYKIKANQLTLVQRSYLSELYHAFVRTDESRIDDGELNRLESNLAEILRKLSNYVPPCYYGIHFLWNGQENVALHCWHLRRVQIDKKYFSIHRLSIKSSGFPFTVLNHALYRYVYFVLISIFSSIDHYRSQVTEEKIEDRRLECQRIFALLDDYLQVSSSGDDSFLKERLRSYRRELLDELDAILSVLIDRGPDCVTAWRKTQLEQVRSFLRRVLPLSKR